MLLCLVSGNATSTHELSVGKDPTDSWHVTLSWHPKLLLIMPISFWSRQLFWILILRPHHPFPTLTWDDLYILPIAFSALNWFLHKPLCLSTDVSWLIALHWSFHLLALSQGEVFGAKVDFLVSPAVICRSMVIVWKLSLRIQVISPIWRWSIFNFRFRQNLSLFQLNSLGIFGGALFFLYFSLLRFSLRSRRANHMFKLRFRDLQFALRLWILHF